MDERILRWSRRLLPGTLTWLKRAVGPDACRVPLFCTWSTTVTRRYPTKPFRDLLGIGERGIAVRHENGEGMVRLALLHGLTDYDIEAGRCCHSGAGALPELAPMRGVLGTAWEVHCPVLPGVESLAGIIILPDGKIV